MILTVHRWFANKSCPGKWMYERMGDLASKVTAALSNSPKEDVKPKKYYRVQIGAYTVKANADAMLKKIQSAGFEDAFIKYSE